MKNSEQSSKPPTSIFWNVSPPPSLPIDLSSWSFGTFDWGKHEGIADVQKQCPTSVLNHSLAGGIPSPLKNMKVKLRWLFPIYRKKHMFKTTNQFKLATPKKIHRLPKLVQTSSNHLKRVRKCMRMAKTKQTKDQEIRTWQANQTAAMCLKIGCFQIHRFKHKCRFWVIIP